MELELARTGSSTSLSGGNATRQRRHYASLDPMSMGVDVQVGPVMNLGSPDFDNNRCVPRHFFKTRTLDRWEYQYNVCVCVILFPGACWTITARLSILNSASLQWKDKALIAAALTRALRPRRRVAALQPLAAIVNQKEMKINCRPAGKSTKVDIV